MLLRYCDVILIIAFIHSIDPGSIPGHNALECEVVAALWQCPRLETMLPASRLLIIP